ncbi:hypothetical protein ACOME3_002571 [Neoechinorhynchus agilis]
MAQKEHSQFFGTDQFSEMDEAYLEMTYQENPMPDEERINRIAQFIGKDPGALQIWYYLRRCRNVDMSTLLRQLLNYLISARIAHRLEVHQQFVPQFFLNSYLPPRPPENGLIEIEVKYKDVRLGLTVPIGWTNPDTIRPECINAKGNKIMISTQDPVFCPSAFLSGGCCSPSCLSVANFMLLAANAVPDKAFSFSPREYCDNVRSTAAIALAKIARL